MSDHQICGAKTRTGGTCQLRPLKGASTWRRTPRPRTSLSPSCVIAVTGIYAIHLGIGTTNKYLSFDDAENLSEQLIDALNDLESRLA